MVTVSGGIMHEPKVSALHTWNYTVRVH